MLPRVIWAMANFGQIQLWPTKFGKNQRWPNPTWPKSSFAELTLIPKPKNYPFFTCSSIQGSPTRRRGSDQTRTPKTGTLHCWAAPSLDRPKFLSFFFFRPCFVLCFSFLWFLCAIGVVFGRFRCEKPPRTHIWALWASCETPSA